MPNFNRSGGGNRGGNSFGRRDFGKRSFDHRDGGRPMMHKATCGECGNVCEVPFKPASGRPVYCNDCFKNGGPNPRKSDDKEYGNREFGGNRDFGRDSGRPGMHTATCDECGNSCEVPFKPNGEKPVYCNNCFKKGGGNAGNNSGNRNADQYKEQFEMLNAKLDKILKALHPAAPASAPKAKETAKEQKTEKVTAVGEEKTEKKVKAVKEPKAKKASKKVKGE